MTNYCGGDHPYDVRHRKQISLPPLAMGKSKEFIDNGNTTSSD